MTDSLERLAAALAGRYRIERELGAGGMATVYLAHDLKHDRQVALKVLKPELAAVLGADRFVQEIKTTAALQHPHILPLFDSGTADSFLYYVMPFIDGETLRSKLDRETQLGIDESVRVAVAIADALDYAHRRGVIHRDIKPENILLHEGRPMVADFGIALAVSAAAGGRMTETGLSLGTPHYMSPEQATAEKEISARSDMYSLASVLYEMLAGQPPHLGGSAQQIIMKIVTEEAAPVTKLRKSVPNNVAAAVAKGLDKLPADRFASAAEFAAALNNPNFATAGAAVAFADGPASLRSLGLRAGILIGVVALIVGAVGATLWPQRSAPAHTSRLMLEFASNETPRYASNGPFPILAQAPDGNGLLYWGPGTQTRAQLMRRAWDQLYSTRIPVTVDEGCCAVVSPGGDSLAYLTGPHALQVTSLNGGIPRTLADSALTSVTDFGGGLDWATDGWIYASGLRGLLRVRATGGKVELVAPLDSTRDDLRFVWPAVLPGGRGTIVTVIPVRDGLNPERAMIGVANVKTGKVEILVPGVRAIYARTGHLIVAKANGSLWAVPFDVSKQRLAGAERALPDTVAAVTGLADFSLSPFGTLAYTKGVIQSNRAVWVDRNGVASPVSADLAGDLVGDPALSPDGTRLVMTITGGDGKSHLWIKSLSGAPKSRVTFDGTANSRAAWRPGTRLISYASDREGASLRVFERNADGSGGTTRLETHDPRAVAAHTWSPDGKWLVFRTDDQAAGNADILAIRPGIDTVPVAIATTAAEEMGPAVSPDNRWIAYSSNETGRREVYVRPFPDASNAHYLISSMGGMTPVWRADGRELYFVDAALNMMAVPVSTGTTFETGIPKLLFSVAAYSLNPFARQFEVTRDGSRFVMVANETDNAVHVVVVFNFLDELRRIMGAR